MRRMLLMLFVVVLSGCGRSIQAELTARAENPGPTATGILSEAELLPTLTPSRTPPPEPTATPRPPAPTEAPSTPEPATLTALEAVEDPQIFAVRPGFEADLQQQQWPEYRMQIDADPFAGTFSGSQVITFTNTTDVLLPDVMLRSYVNFPPDIMGDGGTTFMNVTSASSASETLTIATEAQDTAFRITLPQPLQPGAQVVLNTTFEGTLEPWDDGSWLFASSYPMLAVWNPTINDWFADVSAFPDRVYAQTALYDIDLTLPVPLEAIATGSPITSSSDGSTTTTRFVSGPVREWAASFGEWETRSMITQGITVSVYQIAGSSLDLDRMLDVAVDSLNSFERRFGPYPYRELDLHASLWPGDAGIEYPGFTVILVNQQVNQRTDFVVAHEVAHQWWYALVGNDIFRDPWLDESFANFSSIVAFEDSAGEDAAQGAYEQEILRLYESGKANGDPPAGLAIFDYASFNAYYWAVYGKGALFLIELREELGPEQFWAGMQAYYAATRYQISSRELFQTAMEEASGRSLEDFFDQWLGN